jgi:heavy metal sensor kinase
MKSLRSLIHWSALILMTGLLLIFSVLAYGVGDTLLYRYVDSRLLVLAETLAEIVEQYPNIIESSGKDVARAADGSEAKKKQYQVQDVTHSLRVFSPDGRLVWKAPNASAQQPVPDHMLDQVRLGNPVFETAETADGEPVRHVFISIPRQGPVRYVLQAETSLLLYQETRNGLVTLLILESGAVLLIAWVGSEWLAKKVLTPVEVLSAGAETMSEVDLAKRFTLNSPYQEFRRLIQAFNSVMDRFQRSGEIQRSFCDIAAHEMKTPLTILQGNLEVALLKARSPEEYREALISNLEQVGGLISLTRSLLTLATFTSGKPPVQLFPLALEPMIQDLVDQLTLLADDRQITLSFESQTVLPVLGDAQWLTHALINLLDNALHYTPPGGTVTIRLQEVGEEVAVSVEDTGHGIEPEHLPHLFERFYRTDWARAKDAGGTGLGLAIIKEIAEAHGGTVSVTSQVNKGSVFTLHLPLLSRQTVPA